MTPKFLQRVNYYNNDLLLSVLRWQINDDDDDDELLNAWDIEIEKLLTFFDDFNIISSKQFHEKRLIEKD